MRRVHNESLPSSLLVISNLNESELRVASFPCGICCKNFSSSKVHTRTHKYFNVLINCVIVQNLSAHLAYCKGKYLYPCVYCRDTFISREDYTQHLMHSHKPQTPFQETAVFVGESSHKTKYDKNNVPLSTERSLVYLQPHVTTKEEIFSSAVISNLRALLHYDVALGKRISVRMLCRALIQKFEGDDVINKPFFCQTKQVI